MYDGIDLLMCFSDLECGPLGIFEAAACGCGVLTTHVGNAGSIHGIQLFDGSVDGAIAQLTEWIENPDLFRQYRLEISTEVRNNWDMQHLIRSYFMPVVRQVASHACITWKPPVILVTSVIHIDQQSPVSYGAPRSIYNAEERWNQTLSMLAVLRTVLPDSPICFLEGSELTSEQKSILVESQHKLVDELIQCHERYPVIRTHVNKGIGEALLLQAGIQTMNDKGYLRQHHDGFIKISGRYMLQPGVFEPKVWSSTMNGQSVFCLANQQYGKNPCDNYHTFFYRIASEQVSEFNQCLTDFVEKDSPTASIESHIGGQFVLRHRDQIRIEPKIGMHVKWASYHQEVTV